MRRLVDLNGTRNSRPLSPSNERQIRRNRFLAFSLVGVGLITAVTGILLSRGSNMDQKAPPPKPQVTLNMSLSCFVRHGRPIVHSHISLHEDELSIEDMDPVTGRQLLGVYDPALKVKIHGDGVNTKSLLTLAIMKVESIDQKGVLLRRCDDRLSGDAYNKDLRLDFNKPKLISVKRGSIKTSMHIKAEKGPVAGTVLLNVY